MEGRAANSFPEYASLFLLTRSRLMNDAAAGIVVAGTVLVNVSAAAHRWCVKTHFPWRRPENIPYLRREEIVMAVYAA
ncbi:MAG: hypothetical protein P4L10_15020 [Acidobacteriaceae bacterium]|nr:hypothetical protein [Acidobacteriaceae bacterium]